MSNVWGIHMPVETSMEALEKGFVAIGWYHLGNLLEAPNDREGLKELLRHTYPDKKQGSIPGDAGVLYRFVSEIKKGDFIIHPSKQDRQVNIGRATGKYDYVKDLNVDLNEYPNRQGVEWLASLPRSQFTQSALYEIGSAITLFKVKTHSAEFISKTDPTNAVQSNETQDDIETLDDDSVTSSVSKQAVEATEDYVIRQIYQGLSGHEFEHFVAHVLECMGYTARVTEASGDGGVDVIAHTDELGFEPPIIKVQCKRKTDQTGEPEVSQLLGTLGEGECALFINLGSYSKPARVLERNRSKLRLIDGEQFVKLILEHYNKLSARYGTLIPLKRIHVPDV